MKDFFKVFWQGVKDIAKKLLEEFLNWLIVVVPFIIGSLAIGVILSIPFSFAGFLIVIGLELSISFWKIWLIAFGFGVILAGIRNCPTINLTKVK